MHSIHIALQTKKKNLAMLLYQPVRRPSMAKQAKPRLQVLFGLYRGRPRRTEQQGPIALRVGQQQSSSGARVAILLVVYARAIFNLSSAKVGPLVLLL